MSDIVKKNEYPLKLESVYYNSISSGLANRLRAWITTSAFAEYCKVPYIMKWSSDDACGNVRFHDLFEIPDNMVYVNKTQYLPEPTTMWITINYPNNKFHDEFIQNRYTLSKEEFQLYVNNQRKYLNPISRIQAEIARYEKALDIKNTIGLHIRRTDFKEQDQTPDIWFDKNIQSEIQKNKEVRFFLATDNAWTQEKFLMKYGDRMVVIDKHFNQIAEGERYPGGHRIRHSTTDCALIDLMLLSKTKKVIGSKSSSYGRFGAWFGSKKFIIPEENWDNSL
jgi:hypothetical protein